MKLLLAEDEKEMSRALVKVLELNNYTVDAVYNGRDALDYLMTVSYDGAILDIMMPGMDGLTVLQKLRAGGNNLPVLMLTAKSEIDDRVEGLDKGADDYLTKPFAMKELLARVRAMMRRSTPMTDSILTVGNISLDRTSFTLKCSGKLQRMPNKEYQMLEMLMLHPNSTISTEQFMETVWGWDSEADLNVVWVYLSKIRKILSDIGANVKVKSSRGLGYYLEAEDD